jgi:glutamate-1-semialdehyde aminotransferase
MRLCRAHTGREIILKIDGHFNGGSCVFRRIRTLSPAFSDTSP